MNLIFYLTFNFIFYSFVGWILEEVYSFMLTKKFKKEGFLIGPFKPMYGIAVTLLIICNEVLDIDGIPLLLLCFLIPTTVEYISGYMLKHIFNKVYWDYSNLKYNIHGFVTLKFSLYWMLLSLFGLYYLQPNLHDLYIEKERFFNIVVILGSIVLSSDLYLTLKKLAYERLKTI
jgi:uncharacterized membrane protein